MTDAWEPKHYPTDGPMFERSHWMATLELNDLIEALNAEADAIGIGSGAPAARLLRRAASELRLRQLVDELPAAAEAINHGQEFDDLRAGQMMLELAEADQELGPEMAFVVRCVLGEGLSPNGLARVMGYSEGRAVTAIMTNFLDGLGKLVVLWGIGTHPTGKRSA